MWGFFYSKYLRIFCHTYQSEFTRSLTWIPFVFFSPSDVLPALVCCENRDTWKVAELHDKSGGEKLAWVVTWESPWTEMAVCSSLSPLPWPGRRRAAHSLHTHPLGRTRWSSASFYEARRVECNHCVVWTLFEVFLLKKKKKTELIIAVLNCVVPGSLACSCSGLRLPTPTLTDRRCLSYCLLFMAADTFTSVKSFKFLQSRHVCELNGERTSVHLSNPLTWLDWASAGPSTARLWVDSLGFNDAGGLTTTGQSSHCASGQQLWGRWGKIVP